MIDTDTIRGASAVLLVLAPLSNTARAAVEGDGSLTNSRGLPDPASFYLSPRPPRALTLTFPIRNGSVKQSRGLAVRNLHIAFIGLPHPAHANATFPIASVLVRRGYRVTYTTSPQFEACVNGLGATALICRCFTPAEPSPGLAFAPHPTLRVPDWDLICPVNLRLLKELESSFAQDRPDVIIYDVVAFAGLTIPLFEAQLRQTLKAWVTHYGVAVVAAASTAHAASR